MAAPTVVMQAPASFGGTVGPCPSGNVYTLNSLRQVTALYSDVPTLAKLGFVSVNYPAQTGIIGALMGANFNTTADQQLPSFLSPAAVSRVYKFSVTNASVSLTNAQGGIYTAPAKGAGIGQLVAATQAYTALTGPNAILDLVANPQLKLPAGTPLFLSLTTAQGAPATADIYLIGDQLPR